MADLTNKDFRLNGINQATKFVREDAYEVDVVELGATTGANDLVAIPAGNAVVGFKVIGEASIVGGSDSKVQLGVKAGTTTVNFGTAAAVKAGDVLNVSVNGAAYSADAQTVVLTVSGTALTAGKFIVVVESIPVGEFITRG